MDPNPTEVQSTSTSFSTKLKDGFNHTLSQIKNFTIPPIIYKFWPIILIVLLYFLFVFRRVQRSLGSIDINTRIGPRSITAMPALMDESVRLCDVYVASSFKSYLPCTYYWDYASVDAVTKAVLCGARLIDLDIFNYSFQESSTIKPMVCHGYEVGQFAHTTSIAFEDCVIAAVNTAFDPKHVDNPEDPLFFKLNFYTWGNKETMTQCAKIIKHHCEKRLLSAEYSYQGRNSHKSLATIPLKELVGKVVILSSGDVTESGMDEMTNMCLTHNTYNARVNKYSDYLRGEDIKEIQEFNSKHLSFAEPDVRGTRQFICENFFTAMLLGVQFMCVPYFTQDSSGFIDEYVNIFKGCSFVLKPLQLRYKPTTVPQPKQQNPAVSFAPKTIQMPGITLTY
jgi:hypothetical protein